MLEKIRKLAHNTLFKIFLALLAIAFAIGLGDFSGGGAYVAAKIGKEKITLNEFLQAKQDTINRFNNQQELTSEQSEAISINVINKLVTQSLINQEADDLGIKISPETIAEYIQADKSFYQNGAFDLESYKKTLEYNSLTEAKFIENISKQIASKFLLNSLVVNLPIKDILSDYLYDYLTEIRSVTISNIDTSNTKIPQVTENQLEDYYQKHQDLFKTKEYRNISYLQISSKNLSNKSAISESDLQKEYQENKEEYSLPETRNFYHFLAPDQETAEQVAHSLKKNNDPVKVTKVFVNKKVVSEVFNNQPENSFLSTLNPSLFELDENDVSSPIKSDLGWHIFKVMKINYKEYKTFAQAKSEMIENIQYKMSEIKLLELLKVIEDEIASGTDFKEIANRYDVSLIEVNKIAADGTYASPNKKNIEVSSGLLDLAFQTPLDEESELTLMDDSQDYIILRTNEIIEPRIEDFNIVKDRIKALYISKTKNDIALEIANSIQYKLNEDPSLKLNNSLLPLALKPLMDKYSLPLNKLASISFKDYEIIRPMLGENKDLPEAFASNLFTIGLNKTSNPNKIKEYEYALAIINKIQKNPKHDELIYKKVQEISEENYINKIYDQYLNYLRKKYKVEIHYDLIKQIDRNE